MPLRLNIKKRFNKSKRFIRDGSVQHFKIGGRRKSKRLNKSKRFIRDGSVQHFKIGGRRK